MQLEASDYGCMPAIHMRSARKRIELKFVKYENDFDLSRFSIQYKQFNRLCELWAWLLWTMCEMLQHTIGCKFQGNKLDRVEFPTNRRWHSTCITAYLEQNAMLCAHHREIRIPVGRACNVKLHRRRNLNKEIFKHIKLICECQIKHQMPTIIRFPAHEVAAVEMECYNGIPVALNNEQ